MTICGYRHDDPLLAELCEQFTDMGVDPDTAHDSAETAYEEACANGYGECP